MAEEAAPSFQGNAALEWAPQESGDVPTAGGVTHDGVRRLSRLTETNNAARALGLAVLDDFLPDGGLPTGKVTELVMSGGAAWGTRVALWACRAARAEAALTGTESWCAYIDPTCSLHARGVQATGVELSRLLVLRPALEDVERVVLRLSEARVFSVIVVDLVGVPWEVPRAAARAHTEGRRPTPGRAPTTRGRATSALGPARKRQNWPRTVRQLAMRLAGTQSQVVLLTEGSDREDDQLSTSRSSLPMPVALRMHLRSERSGVRLRIVKEAHGRVGGELTVPWSSWWPGAGNCANAERFPPGQLQSSNDPSPAAARSGRAKSLTSEKDRVRPLLRTISPERQSREAGIPTVASSRFARSSRASL